jgi:adenosine deaminase
MFTKTAMLSALLIASVSALQAQSVSGYFEKIRNNDAALTAFFAQMPKGGDLHHHYSGSVYTETYVDRVTKNDYFINRKLLLVSKDTAKEELYKTGYVRFSSLKDSLPHYQQQLIQRWSVKDYNGVSYPSDKQFFETFGYFGVTSEDSIRQGLSELKKRAVAENLSYIETMLTLIPYNVDAAKRKKEIGHYNDLLWGAQQTRNEKLAQTLLQYIYEWYQQNNVKIAAAAHNKMVAGIHKDAHIDDGSFAMRYQNYVVRVLNPLDVFQGLLVSFESASTSPLIVGVNIVAPENNPVSMRDYWLHMQMYKFCKAKFPNVKYSMHAGELVLGMVQPEELTWHITEAVHTAGADRIGHGVDIPYERNSYDLLRYMASNKIPIEINLNSNEFILKVKEGSHPITLYKDFGVPIVISTDDAGVLRSSITDQYVLLAKRYEDISYRDIKRFVYNSINYSFIEESGVREKLLADLDRKFQVFEEKVREVAGGRE